MQQGNLTLPMLLSAEPAVDARHEGEAKLQPEDLQGRSEIRHAAFFVGLAIAKMIIQVGSHAEACVHSDFLRTGPQAGVFKIRIVDLCTGVQVGGHRIWSGSLVLSRCCVARGIGAFPSSSFGSDIRVLRTYRIYRARHLIVCE